MQRDHLWRSFDTRSVQMGTSRKKLVIDTDPGIGEQAYSTSAWFEHYDGTRTHTTLLLPRLQMMAWQF